MLDNTSKRKIDAARNILVGKVPDPKAQAEQITTAMIYKFMSDLDHGKEGEQRSFFSKGYAKYDWTKLMDNDLSEKLRMELYIEGISKMGKNTKIPSFFRTIGSVK